MLTRTSSFETKDFSYPLPSELIASEPLGARDHSRLLEVGGNGCVDRIFADLPQLLAPGDLLVLNDTLVLKARLTGRKDSGGAAELLVERVEGSDLALCQVRVSKSLQPGRRVEFAAGVCAEVVERVGEFYRLRFSESVLDVLDRHGSVPLPPYMARLPRAQDETRYQTVYASQPGAVAAPTAGLHFTNELLEQLGANGVSIARVTLHVGAGTFQPVRVATLEAHRMHAERYRVPAETVQAIAATRARGGRVVAVGTTVVRALESAYGGAEPGEPRSQWQETQLFITPGYRFRCVDALVTNFHLPESTLLMLVCAFAGYERVMAAYRTAVARQYRFFSYGDAMFVQKAGEGR